MQPKHRRSPNSTFAVLRRIPTAGVLVIGVALGLFVAQFLFQPRASTTSWGGSRTKLSRTSPHVGNARHNIAMPTPQQRRRVFELLTTLTQYNTKDCTRFSQPLYTKQALERYDALRGYSPRADTSWYNPWRAFGDDASLLVRNEKLAAMQHKYFFAINLYNSFDIIPDLFSTLFRVASILGYQNVFLIWQSRQQNAGITCAADYMFHDEIGAPVFYDNWVARDINGTALENAPFEAVFHHEESAERFQHHLPIQVQSCWNGIAVLDPAPFYKPPHVKFRMARIAEGECSASECSLICNDYWNAGYGRIVMVPRVKLAYDKRVFDIIHPPRRNLTAIRGYVRLGGLPDDPGSDPQDRSWYGPHDRLFVPEESDVIDFQPGPEQVWCWGWDGAGDLDGPDVDPIWERMPPKAALKDAVKIRHDRSLL
ncbi:glycosyltransferase family 69 protein [Sphaerobolus stellatus SS14]|uniref:Glycosyltransferase family 69 protein n=1 Tax=Sphaerobolus stellatus (strain SS14) TaxID=990650 RepID=A0A0C9UL43_SPHS4|nr:glycosyltransferase family 69 protein [Sphaerobolus stellatus SS14]